MKIVMQAKPLAIALSLAAGMVDAATKRIIALGHARLATEGDRLAITANVLDFALKLSVPATIEVSGEVAISTERLAALVAGFRGDAEITISLDGTMTSITSGAVALWLLTAKVLAVWIAITPKPGTFPPGVLVLAWRVRW